MRIPPVLFPLLVLGAYLAAVLVVGPYGWDDGAITLAFARSIAAGGEFALTLASERVEGSSSLLTVLLLSQFIPVAPGAFLQQILASQLLTLAALGATLAVLYRPLRGAVPSPSARLAVLALYALLPMHLAEAINGMEMVLLGLLLSLFVLAERHAPAASYLLIPLILATRFEAAFYIGVALSGMILFDRAARHAHVLKLGYLLATFAAFTLGRLAYFGDVLPNTIRAKMNPPYGIDAPPGLSALYHLIAPAQMLTVMLPLIVGALALRLLSRPPRARLFSDPAFWLIAGFLVFALISGPNDGYRGRMFLGALPVMLLLLADQLRAPRGAAILSILLASTLVVNGQLARDNALHVLKAAEARGILPAAIAEPLAPRLAQFDFPAHPEDYRRNGALADDLRTRLGLDQLTILAPDIGGLGLCCDPHALRVVDLALLANRELAHAGYAAFPDQLEREAPDLVLTHWMWAHASGIYDLNAFRDRYRPLVVENTLFWIRADRLARLGPLAPVAGDFDPATLRNDLRAYDFDYLRLGNPHPVLRLP